MCSTCNVDQPIFHLISRVGNRIITILLTCMLLLTSCVEDKVDPLLIGSIQGTIVSKSINEPIEEVEVNTAPVTSVTFTNAEGKFTIDNVPEGEYTILTNAEGYARETIKVKVIRNATTEVSIKLSSANILAPAPESPVPMDGETNQPLTVTLKWSIPNTSDDTLQYAINIYEANQIVPLIEIEGLRDTLYVVENLKYNTAYYWQIDVQSSTGYVTSGDLWLFKTIPFPDNHILFTSKSSGNYELYSSDIAGDSLTRLTYSSSYELRPLFNSNRDKIAFSSNATLDYHIYTMNNDGSGVQRITTLPIAGYHNQGIGFSWSPDNGKFIYSNYNKLYRIDKDGVNLTLLATAPINRNFRACHWTAVNNKIVVETVGSTIYDSEIYLMDGDGTDTVRLVDNLPGIIESPSFSIDGKEILYTHDASGFESEDGRQLDARIYIIEIETNTVIDVSDGKPEGTNDLQPRFSPDGAKIIFMNVSNTGTGLKSVWIMDRDGSNREKLFDGAEMPNWQ
jgi:TolB protein